MEQNNKKIINLSLLMMIEFILVMIEIMGLVEINIFLLIFTDILISIIALFGIIGMFFLLNVDIAHIILNDKYNKIKR